MNILKNPVVIGLLAGTITYLYLMWTNKEQYKKDPESKKTVGIFTPIIVAIITWFLAYNYFGSSNNDNLGIEPIINSGIGLSNGIVPENPINMSVNDNIDMIYSSSDPTKSFHYLGKGISVPNNLPDVFIETI